MTMGILSRIRRWWRKEPVMISNPYLRPEEVTLAGAGVVTNPARPTATSDMLRKGYGGGPRNNAAKMTNPERMAANEEWRKHERERADRLRREREEDEARKRQADDSGLLAAVVTAAMIESSRVDQPPYGGTVYGGGGGGDSGGAGASASYDSPSSSDSSSSSSGSDW